ncbi:MAG: M23 family metallopeptidase [Clostridia bacterium]|nr:M23 family metallopeptidase [Clostridia bacterium]
MEQIEITGNYIVIKDNCVKTLYGHCNKLLVKKGDKVKQGDIIAEVGETGKATGPHLHFEIIKDERVIDPEYVMDF